MIVTKRPLAVVFLTMAAVIILYRLFVGTSDESISVETSFHATGTVASVDKSDNTYTVTIRDVNVRKGTRIETDKKLLLYVSSDSQFIRNNNSLSQKNQYERKNQYRQKNESGGTLETDSSDTSVMDNDLKIGNTIEVRGTAGVFEKSGNPGQFNAYAYYLSKGYAYKVFADRCDILDGSISYGEYLRRIGDYCTGIFERYLPENEAGVISAMMLGRKKLLSEEDKELYKINGLMHILAVSGVKTLKLDIPLVPKTRINWAFVLLHIAIIYILKLCLDEEIIPRCRFPCSRGYLTKCINWQKKQ
ncbi:MAG: hypothetical protein HFH14_00055 [Lachnospiraceae bacterium]|nr:hypothetical protein [Lachnospiraceae bacterium]